MQPEIAVLIPHFNNLNGLYKSLSSVSNQELVDVIVVDDGSKEKPELTELKSYSPAINDIHLISLETNQGVEHALNTGLRYIHDSKKYKYIARMDCGDMSTPERFKIQKDFFESNPEIYLISNYANIVDHLGNFIYRDELPLTHEEMKRVVYIKDPIFHASSMFRVAAIDRVGYYPTNYKYCEDTAYFYKFITRLKTANINQVLYVCEQNPSGISISKYRKQKLTRIRFSLNTFTLKYSFAWFVGLSKNFVCFILGPKISLWVALKINKIYL